MAQEDLVELVHRIAESVCLYQFKIVKVSDNVEVVILFIFKGNVPAEIRSDDVIAFSRACELEFTFKLHKLILTIDIVKHRSGYTGLERIFSADICDPNTSFESIKEYITNVFKVSGHASYQRWVDESRDRIGKAINQIDDPEKLSCLADIVESYLSYPPR